MRSIFGKYLCIVMASLQRNTLFGSVWIMPAGCFHLESLRCRRLQSCADMANPAIFLGNSKKEWEFLPKNTKSEKDNLNRFRNEVAFFTIHYSLFIIHHPSFIIHHSLFSLHFFPSRRPCHHGHIHQHIFDEDTVARCRIIDQNVRHSTYKLAVLDDGRAGQVCGQ